MGGGSSTNGMSPTIGGLLTSSGMPQNAISSLPSGVASLPPEGLYMLGKQQLSQQQSGQPQNSPDQNSSQNSSMLSQPPPSSQPQQIPQLPQSQDWFNWEAQPQMGNNPLLKSWLGL